MKVGFKFLVTKRKKSSPSWGVVTTLALAVTALVVGSCEGLSSDPRLPPAAPQTPNDPSRRLTEQLLGLDLGYNVLNAEVLRQSMGVNLNTAIAVNKNDFVISRQNLRGNSRGHFEKPPRVAVGGWGWWGYGLTPIFNVTS